ncbi:hypothetical protein Q4E93_13155 [Flavitalea sp. BT771]|uniref:hypothetical protein n=1 Tax=Flavitalea sp. BT771 TaxID=3063329 RepID=UPI0026E3A397|nr:hypothetical protein [Flavitalea sp. BT771]MDO6431546.1 hypothetical protein [Flavitalea sp. BT771]MDV6220454.1 hypothetical protein [Flavitalea sp. BT771]
MEHLSFEQLSQIDIVAFLATLDIHPQKEKGFQFSYMSPLPGRRTGQPTFIVDRKRNRWRETSSRQTGTVVDLAVRLYSCTISELRERLLAAHRSVSQLDASDDTVLAEDITIVETRPIHSAFLDRYLWTRRIALPVAHIYCLEACYTRAGQTYQALAFRCDDGGYELYTQRHHYRVPNNSPTHIIRQSHSIAVFRNVFDLLTFATIFTEPAQAFPDFLVLNGPVPFHAVGEQLKPYRYKHLFLPHDPAGIAFTNLAAASQEGIHDHRSLYQGYATLNDWVCRIGTTHFPPRLNGS